MAAGYRMPYPIPRSALHGYNGQYRVAPIHTDSTLYDATADPPRYGHYLKPPSDNRDWPIMGVGARRQYATRSEMGCGTKTTTSSHLPSTYHTHSPTWKWALPTTRRTRIFRCSFTSRHEQRRVKTTSKGTPTGYGCY